jgi:putative membrane protein
MIRTLTLAALAAALLAPQARAQVTATPGTAAQGTAGKAAVNDSLFAMAAADGGLTEVTLSELGVQKATDPELKRFSQQMVAEHTRMNAELMALATRKGVSLPRTVDVRSQFCAQSLAGLSGPEFDKCYAKAQLVIHMDSVATFEAEAERGMDPEMKALAGKSLAHIKQHLAEIKPIAMRYEQERPSTAGARPQP